MAKANGCYDGYPALMDRVVERYGERTGRSLPQNVDGILAAVLLHFGWTPDQIFGLTILALTPSLVAHASEELAQNHVMRIIPTEQVEYLPAAGSRGPGMSGSILGSRVLRSEDPRLLTVGGTYLDDMDAVGTAFVTFVRSTMAHAMIVGLDVEAAASMPGVIGVVTAGDLAGFAPPPPEEMANAGMVQPWLAAEKVRYVGEPIAAIVHEGRYQGEDAAEAVVVDYAELPVVVDPRASAAGGALLFPDLGTNVAFEVTVDAPARRLRRVRGGRPAPLGGAEGGAVPARGPRGDSGRWDGDRPDLLRVQPDASPACETTSAGCSGCTPDQVRVGRAGRRRRLRRQDR